MEDVDDLLHVLQKLQFRCVDLGIGMSPAIIDRFVTNLDRHPFETQIEKVKERISTLQEQLDAHAARSAGSKTTCEAPKVACGALPAASLPQPAHCEDTVGPAAACGRTGDGAVPAAVKTYGKEIATCNISTTGKH